MKAFGLSLLVVALALHQSAYAGKRPFKQTWVQPCYETPVFEKPVFVNSPAQKAQFDKTLFEKRQTVTPQFHRMREMFDSPRIQKPVFEKPLPPTKCLKGTTTGTYAYRPSANYLNVTVAAKKPAVSDCPCTAEVKPAVTTILPN